MKYTQHWHNAITDGEAQRLEQHYRRRGCRTERSLNIDPRFFDLAVTLPETNYLPATPRAMRNRMWN